MLNAVKMDFYRMIRTKSLYVVILIFVMMTVISTILCKSEFDDMEIQQDNYETVMQEENNDTVNAGISVILPTKPGEKVTVYDMFYANVKGKEVALFLVIFAVIFSAADFKSGYIKNIGGQTRKRFLSDFVKGSVSLYLYGIFVWSIYYCTGSIQSGDPGLFEVGASGRIPSISGSAAAAACGVCSVYHGSDHHHSEQCDQHGSCHLSLPGSYGSCIFSF